ncbi:hypothetical protein GCM10009504_19470 [Pseudomonas laurentiana]|nr:hypothetical protein GCM10009504_19470 [Pseudomonas laurentiana]
MMGNPSPETLALQANAVRARQTPSPTKSKELPAKTAPAYPGVMGMPTDKPSKGYRSVRTTDKHPSARILACCGKKQSV